MIKSFKCKYTEALSRGTNVKKFNNIAKVARRKLRQLEIANLIDDLRVPPGNHLEALKGDRTGPPHHPNDPVSLPKQEIRHVGTILTGNSGDQSCWHIAFSNFQNSVAEL